MKLVAKKYNYNKLNKIMREVNAVYFDFYINN